ncbi:alpha/beta hydrolase [Phytoactinopolyspora alkaliphila]|uniref:Alpha/beta hydrolase n=1 Tax=Phytoactinopolyspora alkaliphila TaxID=1783498 RepID=A0A6N9YPA9_9ACTN|nr:alpha/beta hydrolase [Phytoactinopolyspora alkaliphila]NED96901.1 alpha/beta hydrolase [Phytoactinopolyspora alkaliphila]
MPSRSASPAGKTSVSRQTSAARSVIVAILAGLTAAGTIAGTALSAGAGPRDTSEAAAAGEPVSTSLDDQVEAAIPVLDWQTCGEGLEDFLCATAEVPTDYDQPDGDTTTLALTKLPATDPENRIGTLFTNPGGPGGSGVEFVQQMGKDAYTDEVRARFDVLGFDPRAVAASDPATCYRSYEEEMAALATQPAFPVTPSEINRFHSENLRMAVHCRMMSRERIQHSSTANVARDMDLLRQAVGDERLTYMGYSYGTFLGATYAKLFPDRVRALALDGTMVPEHYAGQPGREDASVGERLRQGYGASDTFGEFLRLCTEAGPDACALAALGDPETVVEETLERLKSDPAELVLPDGGTVEVTYATAVALTFSSLYEPGAWAAHAGLLTQLAAGDAHLSGAAAALAERSLPHRPRRGEDYPSVGGNMASTCVDSGTTGDPRGYADQAEATDKEAPHFGRYRAWIVLPCEYLRLTDDDAYTGPWDQEVDTPVLVIGTRFDPATPYEGTEPYAAHFPDARIVTVEGYGHTVLGKSSCADETISEYLVELSAPADGSTCSQDVAPFAGDATPDERTLARIPAVPLGQ